MQKRAFIFLALFVLVAIASIATAEISFKFEDNIIYEFLPTQIRIKTTNSEQLKGMKFTGVLTPEQQIQDPKPDIIRLSTLSTSQSSIYGYSDAHSSGCINTKTNTIIASIRPMRLTPVSFQIIVDGPGTWDKIYNKDDEYGEWEILCTVTFIKPETTFSSNLQVEYGNNQIMTIQASNMPTWGIPSFELNTITSQQHGKDKNMYTEVSFNLKLNRIGVYQIGWDNAAVNIKRDRNLWCKGNGDDKFAYMQTVTANDDDKTNIYVTKLPNDNGNIECKIKYEYINRIDETIDVNMVTTLTSHYEKLTKVDFVTTHIFPTSFFHGYVTRASQNEINIAIDVEFALEQMNAINDGKTLDITFSSQMPIDKLSNELSYCGDKFERNGNIISVTIVKKSKSLSCVFGFKTNFDYELWKGATISLRMNDIDIQSYENKSIQELIINPSPKIKFLDSKMKMDTNDMVYTDRIEIYNNERFLLPVTNAVVILSLDGTFSMNRVSLSDEDFSKQLQCQSNGIELKLNYDEPTMSWSIAMTSPMEDGKVDFKYVITCTRSYPKLMKYGLITNSNWVGLKAAIITVVKGNRYSSVDIADSDYDTIDQPTTKPTDELNIAPLTIRARTSSYVTVPTNKDMTIELYNDLSKDYIEYTKSIIEQSIEDDYNDVKPLPKSYAPGFILDSMSLNYVDFESESQYIKFITQELKAPIEPHNNLRMGNVAFTSGLSHGINRYIVSLSSNFELTPKDNKNTPQIEIDIAAFNRHLQIMNSNSASVPIISDLAQSRFEDSTSTQTWMGLTGTRTFMTQIEKCGAIDGFSLTAPLYDDEYFKTWENVRTAKTNIYTCGLGDSCKVNADCSRQFDNGVTVCKNQKCTFKPYSKAKWVDITSSNNAIVTTMFIALVITICTIVF